MLSEVLESNHRWNRMFICCGSSSLHWLLNSYWWQISVLRWTQLPVSSNDFLQAHLSGGKIWGIDTPPVVSWSCYVNTQIHKQEKGMIFEGLPNIN